MLIRRNVFFEEFFNSTRACRDPTSSAGRPPALGPPASAASAAAARAAEVALAFFAAPRRPAVPAPTACALRDVAQRLRLHIPNVEAVVE